MKGTEIAKLVTRVVSKVCEGLNEVFESMGDGKKWKMLMVNREVLVWVQLLLFGGICMVDIFEIIERVLDIGGDIVGILFDIFDGE